MTNRLQLEPRLDLVAVRPLVESLLGARGADLTIDAGGVERLGGLALQALLAAQQVWARDGNTLAVTPRSSAFDAALASFGVAAATFGGEAA